MSKKSLFFSVVLLITFSLFSCEKENEVKDTLSSEDLTLTEDILNSIEESVDELTFNFTGEINLDTRTSPCVDKSSTAPLGEFPNTITLDYGDGCEGPHGRMRTGKIIINISDKMHNEGAVRSVGFENFFVDEVQITGTKSMTNNGVNEEGIVSFSKEVNDITLLFPNGSSAIRNAFHTMLFLEGYDTAPRFDNLISITGNASGINRNGTSYSVLITEALIKKGNCRWIVSGVKEIVRNGETVFLDYGDGACNKAGVLTFEDGTTKEINLSRKWW